MKGETCVRGVPGFNYRTVPLAPDFSTRIAYCCQRQSVTDALWPLLKAISAIGPNNFGNYSKMGGEGSVMKTVVNQAHAGVVSYTSFDNLLYE